MLAGAQAFGQATTANVGRLFAIVLDGVVISAPRINTPIQGGAGFIQGNFTPQSRTGSLDPAALRLAAGQFTVVERRVVGAGLGQDSFDAAVVAAWVSGGLIVRLHYRDLWLFRLIALLAIVVNVVLILGIMSVLGSTLTCRALPGLSSPLRWRSIPTC